jgi:3-phenylpropionate/trans-cinnamate dioxygenase ferredoxin subunit
MRSRAGVIDVGPVADFPEGEIRIVSNRRHEVGIANVGGRLYAIRNRCPHRGAPICRGELRGTMLPSDPGEFVPGLRGRVLHCPWHQWEFDVTTGAAMFGIDDRRLVRYPVQVVGGRVLLGRSALREPREEAT